MVIFFLQIVCPVIILFGFLSTANAALEVRLGGKAVYDTDLNITWLTNANAGAGSKFDNGTSTTDGLMDWHNANAWAESINIEGISGWRLPTALNSDGSICGGFNCTGSEMGHLFYIELSGTAHNSILTSSDPDLSLFSNIQGTGIIYPYWLSTIYQADVNAYSFQMAHLDNFFAGAPSLSALDNEHFGWAVHDGDVALIPEPQTYAMLFLGILAIIGHSILSQRN